MNGHKSPIRQQIEKIDKVARTWLELDLVGGATTKALIVEVDFDTDQDAGSSFHHDAVLQKIWTTYAEAKGPEFNRLTVVPKNRPIAVGP
jgi:hypothetical protein